LAQSLFSFDAKRRFYFVICVLGIGFDWACEKDGDRREAVSRLVADLLVWLIRVGSASEDFSE